MKSSTANNSPPPNRHHPQPPVRLTPPPQHLLATKAVPSLPCRHPSPTDSHQPRFQLLIFLCTFADLRPCYLRPRFFSPSSSLPPDPGPIRSTTEQPPLLLTQPPPTVVGNTPNPLFDPL
ncbi:hypothetical protein RIF29_24921 [Crotalaria pallida]|uniref:Uncharacterized protein n=1 Tax=Crotalaria pallida TaxID=3830 RepID=A0AAN9EL76_CROPI